MLDLISKTPREESSFFHRALHNIREEKIFYLGLAAILVIGCVLIAFDATHSWGEALVIAAVLAGTVDSYLKGRFAKEIARDISPYVMAYAIPDLLRDEVAEICRLKLYRRDFKLSYEIQGNEGDKNVRLIMKCSFELVSLHDDAEEFEHLVWVEKRPHTEDFQQIPRVTGEGALNAHGVREDYVSDGSDAVEKNGGYEWKRRVLIPPKSAAAPRFSSETHQILPCEHFETFLSFYPAVGLELKVKHPEWLTVEIRFAHRLGNGVQVTQDGPDSQVWNFKPALLPFASVQATWRPKKGTEQGLPSPSPAPS